jgi:hypothetical protein
MTVNFRHFFPFLTILKFFEVKNRWKQKLFTNIQVSFKNLDVQFVVATSKLRTEIRTYRYIYLMYFLLFKNTQFIFKLMLPFSNFNLWTMAWINSIKIIAKKTSKFHTFEIIQFISNHQNHSKITNFHAFTIKTQHTAILIQVCPTKTAHIHAQGRATLFSHNQREIHNNLLSFRWFFSRKRRCSADRFCIVNACKDFAFFGTLQRVAG